MSRSNHPTKRNKLSKYYKYKWWMKHGDKSVRKFLEKRFRQKTKLAIHHDKDKPTKPEDPKWIWW